MISWTKCAAERVIKVEYVLVHWLLDKASDKKRLVTLFSLWAVAVFFAASILAMYGLIPTPLHSRISIAAGVLLFLLHPKDALLLTLSLFIFSWILAGTIELAFLSGYGFYRPHERLNYCRADNRPRYKSNKTIRMNVPHGDLAALSLNEVPMENITRKVEFYTDSIGFRNRRNYKPGDEVLVGDSFIVGSGGTQEDTLAEQLQTLGIPSYSAAHPGIPMDYWSFLQELDDSIGERPKIHLFIFEGNDWGHAAEPRRCSPLKLGPWETYLAFLRNTSLFRLTFVAGERFMGKTMESGTGRKKVKAWELNGRLMAFNAEYINGTLSVSQGTDRGLEAAIDKMRDRIKATYFIPTKYRVYRDWLSPAARALARDNRAELPHARWDQLERLCRDAGLKCIDLTPALKAAAGEALKKGEFIYWTDDTHWKADGIRVAAEAVKTVLGGRTRQ